MKEFWDARYSNTEFVYGVKPNKFFEDNLDKSEQGKLLLPGDGEGRNSVYAAKLGWNVTAFDYSTSAKGKALLLAKENKVNIDYFISDAVSFKTGEKFDLISIIFFHLTPKLRLEFHRRLKYLLNPGGKIILECFSKEQLEKSSGGPKSIDLLYSKKQLEIDFDYLNILMLEEKEIELSEGSFHQGKASVVRMIAENS
ncbi:MAG: SAM-dependent methyltransferase [Marinilabiliales bacterium]|nr:MAG: SAM-dependent methyltransferase [Marinilabiliales bacterium]